MADEGFNWTCGFCSRDQVVTDASYYEGNHHIRNKDSVHGPMGYELVAVTCANVDCRELTVVILLRKQVLSGYDWVNTDGLPFHTQRLRPSGLSKLQPNYIPRALRDDYSEACAIRDLSPKAAASLARRCLQGMIRDFAKVTGKNLYDEINNLMGAVERGDAPRDVSIESVQAIDNVRTIGNIGAHMEADVDHIVSVDAGEAQLLIDLVESLFDEWYIERHQRHARFATLGQVAAEKKAQIAQGKALRLPKS